MVASPQQLLWALLFLPLLQPGSSSWAVVLLDKPSMGVPQVQVPVGKHLLAGVDSSWGCQESQLWHLQHLLTLLLLSTWWSGGCCPLLPPAPPLPVQYFLPHLKSSFPEVFLFGSRTEPCPVAHWLQPAQGSPGLSQTRLLQTLLPAPWQLQSV